MSVWLRMGDYTLQPFEIVRLFVLPASNLQMQASCLASRHGRKLLLISVIYAQPLPAIPMVNVGLPRQVRLTRCATEQPELAEILSLSREDAKSLIDARWWMGLGETNTDLDQEPDRHWDWTQLVSVHQNKPYFRAVCIKTLDGAIQAASLFRVDALSALELDRHAVFVDRLATAPRNRHSLVKHPVFRGAGIGLLVYAIVISYSLGFEGRVNLFSAANEEFYLRHDFVPTGVTDDDGVRLLEIPVAVARSLLLERGLTDV